MRLERLPPTSASPLPPHVVTGAHTPSPVHEQWQQGVARGGSALSPCWGPGWQPLGRILTPTPRVMLSPVVYSQLELLPRVCAGPGGGTWGQSFTATGVSPRQGTDEATQLAGVGGGREAMKQPLAGSDPVPKGHMPGWVSDRGALKCHSCCPLPAGVAPCQSPPRVPSTVSRAAASPGDGWAEQDPGPDPGNTALEQGLSWAGWDVGTVPGWGTRGAAGPACRMNPVS